MADYKTYTCDICDKHNAQRFTFPAVDTQEDICDGSVSVRGSVDLCLEHTPLLFKMLMDELQPSMDRQRYMWKKILHMKEARNVAS